MTDMQKRARELADEWRKCGKYMWAGDDMADFLLSLAAQPAEPVAYMFTTRDKTGVTPHWRQFAAIDFTPQNEWEEVLKKDPLVYAHRAAPPRAQESDWREGTVLAGTSRPKAQGAAHSISPGMQAIADDVAKRWEQGRAIAATPSVEDERAAALAELVEALDATTWSSWQTTAKFDPALKRARAALKGGTDGAGG